MKYPDSIRPITACGLLLLAGLILTTPGRAGAQPVADPSAATHPGSEAAAVPGGPSGAATAEELREQRMREIERMRAERGAAYGSTSVTDVSAADADGDGKFSEAELTVLVRQLMAGSDADSDTLLDERELMRMFSDGMRSAAMARRPETGPGVSSADLQNRLGAPGAGGAPGVGVNSRFSSRGAAGAGVPGAGYDPGASGAGFPGAGAARSRFQGAGVPGADADPSAMSLRIGSREIAEIIMAKLDANGDGRIQKEEAPQPVLAAFDELDTDGNGSLGPEDGDRMSALRRRSADRTAGAGVPGATAGSSPMAHYIDRFDQDGDGALTRAELPEHMHRLFEVLDTDKDDRITPGEFENRTRPGRPGAPGDPGDLPPGVLPGAAR